MLNFSAFCPRGLINQIVVVYKYYSSRRKNVSQLIVKKLLITSAITYAQTKQYTLTWSFSFITWTGFYMALLRLVALTATLWIRHQTITQASPCMGTMPTCNGAVTPSFPTRPFTACCKCLLIIRSVRRKYVTICFTNALLCNNQE